MKFNLKRATAALVVLAVVMFIATSVYAYVCDGGRYSVTQGGKERFSYACLDDGNSTVNVDLLTTASLISGGTWTFSVDVIFDALLQADGPILMGNTLTMDNWEPAGEPFGQSRSILFGDTAVSADSVYMYAKDGNLQSENRRLRLHGDFVPDANNVYTLGQSGNLWNRLYASQVIAPGNSSFGIDGVLTPRSTVTFGAVGDEANVFVYGSVAATQNTISFFDGSTTGPSGIKASLKYNNTVGGTGGVLWDENMYFIGGKTLGFGETVGTANMTFLACDQTPCAAGPQSLKFPDATGAPGSDTFVMGAGSPETDSAFWFTSNDLMYEGSADAFEFGILFPDVTGSSKTVRFGTNVQNGAAILMSGTETDPNPINAATADLDLLTGVNGGGTLDLGSAPLAVDTVNPSLGDTVTISGNLEVTGGVLAGTTIEATSSIYINNGMNAQIVFEGNPGGSQAILNVLNPSANRNYYFIDRNGYVIMSEANREAANSVWGIANGFGFEGATADGFNINLTAEDPGTSRSHTIPDVADGELAIAGAMVSAAAANQACSTTCATDTCLFGFDAGTSAMVDCASALADTCICQ